MPHSPCMRQSHLYFKTNYCNITDSLPSRLRLSLLRHCSLVAAVDAAAGESGCRFSGRIWFRCVWIARLSMWILGPVLTSVTTTTQTNSSACSRRPQPANSPGEVRTKKKITLHHFNSSKHSSWEAWAFKWSILHWSCKSWQCQFSHVVPACKLLLHLWDLEGSCKLMHGLQVFVENIQNK